LELLGKVQCLFHACRGFVQVADHEAAMHHDPRLLAAAHEAMSFLVIFRIPAIVIVLLHAVNDFHIAALEPDAEQTGASFMQSGEQLPLGPNVSAAVRVEWQLVAAAN